MDTKYFHIDMSYEPLSKKTQPLSDERKKEIEYKLKQIFPEPFKLWNFVFILCAKSMPQITIDHLLPGASEEDTDTLDRTSQFIRKTQTDRKVYINLLSIAAHVPGACQFARLKNLKNSHDQWGVDMLTTFVQIPYGKALSSAVLKAIHLHNIDAFTESIHHPNFTQALIDIGNILNKNITTSLITLQADKDTDPDVCKLAMEMQPIKSRQDLDAIFKAQARIDKAKKRSKDKESPNFSIKDMIMNHWLPLVLWRKSAAEILEALPELKSGELAGNHDRDCKNINKHIKELGISRDYHRQ